MKGEKVVFTKGPVADAVRASISIPGIFVPAKIDGRLLVDGGVIDRVPVSVVKEMGADLVIAVDVSRVKTDAEITNIYDVIMQSLDIMQMELVENRQIASDIMIRPPVEKYSARAFTNIRRNYFNRRRRSTKTYWANKKNDRMSGRSPRTNEKEKKNKSFRIDY